MKKLIRTLSLLILALALSITAVSCTFINDGPSGSGDPSGLPSASTQAQSVVLNTHPEQSRVELSLKDAVTLTDRTAVAIEMESGVGSGVIIDVADTGNFVYVITCHHVISSGGKITVLIPDEECSYENNDFIFEGEIGGAISNSNAVSLVGGDRVSDIAVIKIDLSKPAVSGNVLALSKIQKAKIPTEDYKLVKGERVFSIGNPTGELPGSVADGVISYLEREVKVSEVGNMRLLQISVTTNPGNSGGGLYNLYGELVGITNAGNTSYQSINYAIPVTSEKGNGFVDIAKQLIGSATATNYGYVDGRWEIGIEITRHSSLATYYFEISKVIENSNASKAGLQVGDIINSIKIGEEIYSLDANNMNFYMGLARTELKIGDRFTLNVSRKIAGSNKYEAINVEVLIEVSGYIFMNTGA